MGCLNSSSHFQHVFGNIHLSGPCNRACYFCIGQHMMALDGFNNLNQWPLKNIDTFIEKCLEKKVSEIYLTGTNTDSLLYNHLDKLKEYIKYNIPNVLFGARTNGATHLEKLKYFDKASVTICSLDKNIHLKMMGKGEPANIEKIIKLVNSNFDLKVNIVLGPENVSDILHTILALEKLGIKRINLREPYGQPHIGDPLSGLFDPSEIKYGMATYDIGNTAVTYWDVHYVEVESINLYANGNVSTDYPISRGHDITGVVKDQSFFSGGRVNNQWISFTKK